MQGLLYKCWVGFFLLLYSIVFIVVMSTPMGLANQWVFGGVTVLLLICMGQTTSRRVRLAMVLLTAITSTRYMYWRVTETLVTDGIAETVLSTGLLAAECYAWLVLIISFFQVGRLLERKIVPLPDDTSGWPTVDVYIPTYNEGMEVVRDSVLAAQNLDYPSDKLNIYLLDDGKRPEFGAFASRAGVGYITRDNNEHAKAGNLNNALKVTNGELICIFDCDHITTRAFLQATVGAFLDDENLALIQTPHHFYSPDPFERNLVSGRDIPHEGNLFYGAVQKGNDYWNATFFCGSCAVIRRSALDQTDGFAVETVTEDAHTALKLQRKGWSTAYLGIPLAAGLATERLSLHIVQRARWARGMTQIMRRDNPLLGVGLTFAQRLCYLNAMLHFQFPLARFVFLTAPLAYLLFGLDIIEASPEAVAAYVLPHLFGVVYTNAKLVGQYRYTFWNEIYETVLTFHLLKPTLVTLFDPKRGKFDVTDKGGVLDHSFFDFNVLRPHLFVLVLLLAGVIWGTFRLFWWNSGDEQLSVLLFNVIWASFSALFLLAAVAVGSEQKQVREYVRIDLEFPAVIHLEGEYTLLTSTQNLSMGGIQVEAPSGLPDDADIEYIEMSFDNKPMLFPVELIMQDKDHIRLKFYDLDVNQRRELVKLVMGRADSWLEKGEAHQDKPIRSIITVVRAVAGLFFKRWKERALFSGGNGGGQKSRAMASNGNASGAITTTSKSTWAWRAFLVALIVLGIISSQRAWSQTVDENSVPPTSQVLQGVDAEDDPLQDQENELPSSFLSNALPSVGLDAEGELDFGNAVSPGLESREHVFPLQHSMHENGGGENPVRIQGNGSQVGLDFSISSSEVVTDATLNLEIQYSDAMLEGVSRLDIVLNGVIIDTIQLDRFNAEGYVAEIEVPPEQIVTYNTLLLSVNGQTLSQCNNVLSEDIWVEVNPDSSLNVSTQVLPPIVDLSRFPAPFFDDAAMERLSLPFVLPDEPSEPLLAAAGIVASQFAVFSSFRGADFPVHHDQLPNSHAVVMGTRQEMPLGVLLPETISGPTILQLQHPDDPLYRLLVLTGRNDQEVRTAARYLTQRHESFSGQSIKAENIPVEPRQAFDAPKWQSLDEPIYLESLVNNEDMMRGEGVRPAPQRYSFRLPPLFVWAGDDVGLQVNYRFPQGEWLDIDESRLEVSLNEQYLDGLPVEKDSIAWDIWKLLGNDIRQEEAVLQIPQEQLYGNNQLTFYFNMGVHLPEEGCDLGLPEEIETRILPQSHIDLREAHKFAALPELSYWVSAGYPFTQWADLSQTSLLVPEVPQESEISAALGMVGRMANAAGYPSYGLDIRKGLDLSGSLANRDLLVVALSDSIEQSSLNGLMDPFAIEGETVSIEPSNLWQKIKMWAKADLSTDTERARNELTAQAPQQALMATRSPLNDSRSMIVATGFSDNAIRQFTSVIDQPEISNQSVGDLVTIDENDVESYRVAEQRIRGDISWNRLVRWYAGQYIIPILLLMAVVVLLTALVLHGTLNRREKQRIHSK
ncbi:UDP-forming cellulose synthase catalytic subunit [Halomonas sp. CUBES01]|uniref:UDP-forming cellulose synthase catalytic subunit n=1 Tax=Halomonas sp. CUBES01 TaxID=2897340 RepID=UPI001E5CA22F|nr:UDP-forming cellulose synthase catalytic subunit [Halomonas sp. CUBES01]MEC4766680.1 UDP-forming cellulose synthase catalytic subunit [Halomonas sp. CUBES01]